MTKLPEDKLRWLELEYQHDLEAEPKYHELCKQLAKARTWRERFKAVGQEYREIKGPNNWHESAIKDDFGFEILPELQELYALGLNGLDCVLYSFDEVMETNRDLRTAPELAAFNMPVDHLFFFGGNGLGDHFCLAYNRDGSMKDEIWIWDHESDERKAYCRGLNDLIARYFSRYGGYGQQAF